MDSVKAIIERHRRTRARTPEPNPALSAYAAELRTELGPAKPAAPACPCCGGAGYVVRNVPVGDPDFERPIRCPECGPARERRRLAEYSRLEGEALTFRFAGYWAGRYGAKGHAALFACQALLATQSGWVTLYGRNGLGKSYLLAATVNEARERGIAALYVTMTELLNALRKEIRAGDERFETLRRRLWETAILAVDEVDRYNETEWAETTVFELVEFRYRHWDRMGTLWATNNFKLLPDYFQDRMSDGRFEFVEFEGDSVRPELRRDREASHGESR